MKIRFYILIPLILGGTLFFLTTCKQTEQPCAGAKEPTAAFTMMEVEPVSYFGFTTYDTDTAGPGDVQFTALEPNAKYEWKIGTDTTIFTKQQFMLNFANYWVQNQPNVPPVTVTLKVIKTPGSCFPISDSVKYVTRTLFITNVCLLNGTFKGYFNKDTLQKTLFINVDTIIDNRNNGIYIKGLLYHDSIFMDDGQGELAFYRKLIFNFTSTGANLNFNNLGKGEFMVTPDGKTIHGWITQTDPKLPSTYTFTGIRIH